MYQFTPYITRAANIPEYPQHALHRALVYTIVNKNIYICTKKTMHLTLFLNT